MGSHLIPFTLNLSDDIPELHHFIGTGSDVLSTLQHAEHVQVKQFLFFRNFIRRAIPGVRCLGRSPRGIPQLCADAEGGGAVRKFPKGIASRRRVQRREAVSVSQIAQLKGVYGLT